MAESQIAVEVEYGSDRQSDTFTYLRESISGGDLSDDEIMDMAEKEASCVAGPQPDIQSVSIV